MDQIMEKLSLIAPIMVGNIILFWLIAKWYALPRLKALTFTEAFSPILILHSARFLGLMFISGDVVRVGMPEAFSVPAAYGDLSVAVLAGIALVALRQKSPSARALIWLFNIAGIVDLLYAVTIGVLSNASAYMGAAYFIPAIIVPGLLVSHVMTFQLLLQKEPLPSTGAVS
jgi:hypothetical protein